MKAIPANYRKFDPETLGLRALAFLAADSPAFEAFMGACGADAQTVRSRAADPEFLGFVLDHLLTDDRAVLAFAEAEGIAPEAVLQARAGLPGGDAPHWT